MEFNGLNDLNRLRHLGAAAPWVASEAMSRPGSPVLTPAVMRAALARARLARALAIQAAFRGLGRALTRAARRVLPRLPAGAHGPEAIDYDCAHGRPC